jgi:hypothetical protein
LPGAQLAEVDDRIGIGFEDRTAALDNIGVTADHHQQTSL